MWGENLNILTVMTSEVVVQQRAFLKFMHQSPKLTNKHGEGH